MKNKKIKQAVFSENSVLSVTSKVLFYQGHGRKTSKKQIVLKKIQSVLLTHLKKHDNLENALLWQDMPTMLMQQSRLML